MEEVVYQTEVVGDLEPSDLGLDIVLLLRLEYSFDLLPMDLQEYFVATTVA